MGVVRVVWWTCIAVAAGRWSPAGGDSRSTDWRGGDGEQAEDQGERPCSQRDGVAGYAAFVRAPQRAASARAQVRLWPGAVWCLLGALGREGDPELCDSGGGGEREGGHDPGGSAGPVCAVAGNDGVCAGVASVAAGVDRRAGAALRLLPERDDDPGCRSAQFDEESDRGSDPDGDERSSVPVRDVSADPDGDQAGGRCDGEGRE